MAELAFMLGLLFLLFFIGVPVAFSLGVASIIGILVFLGPAQLSQIVNISYTQGVSTTLLVAPLFILMSEFISQGDIAKDIFSVLSRWLKKIPGGLAVSNIFACSVFAALCGSSPVTAATIGKISIPQMTANGYSWPFSLGTTAAGGTIGILIPPSLSLIVFGIITETSIPELLMAGFMPGILLALLFSAYIIVKVKLDPSLVTEVKANSEAATTLEGKSFAKDLVLVFPSVFLVLITLGTMYIGWVTPTEAAGVGALGAFLIVLFMKRLNWVIFKGALLETAKTTSMLMFLIITGMVFAFVLTTLGIPQEATELITGLSANKWIILIAVYILWLILGCILDPMGMVIISVPLLFKPLVDLGFDPVWIGVVSTITVMIGMITPPIGLNLFVLKAVTGRPFEEVVSGTIPFFVVMVLFLALVTVFPEIIMFIPNTMR